MRDTHLPACLTLSEDYRPSEKKQIDRRISRSSQASSLMRCRASFSSSRSSFSSYASLCLENHSFARMVLLMSHDCHPSDQRKSEIPVAWYFLTGVRSSFQHTARCLNTKHTEYRFNIIFLTRTYRGRTIISPRNRNRLVQGKQSST